MMDLIKRSDVLQALYTDSDEYSDGNTYADLYEQDKEIINSIPVIEAIPKEYLLRIIAKYGKEITVSEALKAWEAERVN